MSIGGCDKCGGAHFSGLHPLMPGAFDKSCKCNDTCTCGKYVDDFGQWLGWRSFMACNCPLKSQRIAKHYEDEEKAHNAKISRAYLINLGSQPRDLYGESKFFTYESTPQYKPPYDTSNFFAWKN